MFTPSYLLSLSACVLTVTYNRVRATGEYCHGWTDQRDNWREGFYCPEKEDRKSAIICCGRCEYRYCCSDGTARLDQGTCTDSDPDRKLPSRGEVVADEFIAGDYPVYVPFLIVGSAFLALLLFGGSACFLYSRQSSSQSVAVATTATAMTTTLSCSSSTSLGPHGDRPLGDQPRCRGNSCHPQHLCRRGNQPGSGERPAVDSITQPLPPCAHCSAQHSQLAPSPAHQHANQHANQQANQQANQHVNQQANQHANQHVVHGYPLNPPRFPTLHFNTHPQAGSAHSKSLSPAQYATLPHPGSAHVTPWPLATPFPRLPISPQQLPPGMLIPAALLRGYILPSQHAPAPTPQYRIPSPPPSLTLTHHPMV